MYRVILNVAAASAVIGFVSNPANAVEVHMFKGAGDFSFVNENMHFSRGLNEMSDILNSEGIRSEVRRFGQIEDALASIRSRKPKSVVFVGHSMGALASMAMARNLKNEGVNIAYMGLIDIPGPVGVAGENVEWVENYFSINPVYARLTNTKTHPNAQNIHVLGYIHNRMDDSPKVQNGILAAIRKVHAVEQKEQVQPDLLMVQKPVDTSNGAVTTVANSYSPAPIQQQPVFEQNGATSSPTELQFDPSLSVTYVDAEGNQQPYPLPSVRPPEYVGANAAAYQPAQPGPPSGNLDPVTTSGVEQPGIVSRGKQLLSRAGNYLRRSGTPRKSPANRNNPDR